MKDKLVRWHIVDSKGKDLCYGNGYHRRKDARRYIKIMTADIFEKWNKGVNYPLHLERVEFHMVSKEKVW